MSAIKKSKCKKCGLEIPVDSVVKHFSVCRPNLTKSSNSTISANSAISDTPTIQTSKKCDYCEQ